MKKISIVIGALLGTMAIAAGMIYIGVTHWARWSAAYGPELTIDAQGRAQEAEDKLKQATDAYSRWAALWKSALHDRGDAQALATELLGMTETYRTDWNYGNAIYKANSALGRIALRSGTRWPRENICLRRRIRRVRRNEFVRSEHGFRERNAGGR